MTPNELFEYAKNSVVKITFIKTNGSDTSDKNKKANISSSGTGFFLNGYFVTNFHVFLAVKNSDIVLLSKHDSIIKQEDGQIKFEKCINIPAQFFQERMITSSEEQSYDYAIFDLPITIQTGISSLKPSSVTYKVGQEIAFLGYPLGSFNPVFHRGMISSLFESKITKIIQLDASINNGDSGGPLLNIETGEVIGIITRKLNGLTETFNKLHKVVGNNIEILNKVKAGLVMDNVSVGKMLLMGQNEIKALLYEIERSANVGIGHAFSIQHVVDDLNTLGPLTPP